MPTHMVIRNRAVLRSQGYRKRPPPPEVPRNRNGEIISTAPIPSRSPQAVFRAGEAYWHPEDKVNYRIVCRLEPQDGWASSDFWQDRYKVDHRAIVKFVEMGMLDAAMEEQSQVCRFRCRDEVALRKDKAYKTAQRRVAQRRQTLANRSLEAIRSGRL